LELGVKISQYLESKGIKQSFVAEKAKIRQNILSRILRGERACRADEYINICRVIDVPLDMFTEEKEGEIA
jgi:transcriptional regulator with XRE-family HTH domain